MGGYAFEDCDALQIADLISAMVIGDNAFEGSGIKYLRLGESLKSLGVSSFNVTPNGPTIYYGTGEEAWENKWGEQALAQAALYGAGVKPASAWEGDIAAAQSAAGQLLVRFGF